MLITLFFIVFPSIGVSSYSVCVIYTIMYSDYSDYAVIFINKFSGDLFVLFVLQKAKIQNFMLTESVTFDAV